MNKYGAQVWVLPEDDANRQIAGGFLLEPAVQQRNVQVLRVAGGWAALRDSFAREYNDRLSRSPDHLMVLLVDFDGRGQPRLDAILGGVDEALRDRVFVLGAEGEPEEVRKALGKSYEQIGKALAGECRGDERPTWDHPLLVHNRPEIERMKKRGIRKLLFGK